MDSEQAVAVAEVEPAKNVFAVWVDAFARAIGRGRADEISSFFDEDASWKDMLALTWDFPTYLGADQIEAAWEANLRPGAMTKLRVSDHHSPARHARRGGRQVIEGFFDFDTPDGHGTAFVRLTPRPGEGAKISNLLTALQELNGFEEAIDSRRPSGNEFSQNTGPGNWLDMLTEDQRFNDRDPQVLIVGAGHAGLILAARLKVMGIDALVIERKQRIGQVWRDRYHSLTLHNQTFANHMPYMPFPPSWPVWLPKDKLAGWMEAYAQALELAVWTSTEFVSGEYDEQSGKWAVRLSQADGSIRQMEVPQLVIATGVSGSRPKRPDMPGLSDYKGEVVHSAEFTSGKRYSGKNVLVVGTGNSGHDIAQDLHVNGANVTVLQRGATCVVSLEPTATRVYKIYSGDMPPEDVDLLAAAVPYPVMIEAHQHLTRQAREDDAEMLASLEKVGFKTFHGEDDTGFHLMYLRGNGGYYIDVGCVKLIADGSIKVIQYDDLDSFVSNGARMKDGALHEFDLVVTATGFEKMECTIQQLLGEEVAQKVGPVWGLAEDHSVRGLWRQTGQKGLWLMGGALMEARLNSRFLALQIGAALLGRLPERKELRSGVPTVCTSQL